MLLTMLVAVSASTSEGSARDLLPWLRRERFVYSQANSRDPFLFRGREREEPVIDRADEDMGVVWHARARIKPRPDPKQVSKLLESALTRIQRGEYDEARRLVSLASRGVEGLSPEAIQRMETTRKALKFLLQRKQAEDEFSRLPVTVDAIYLSTENPVAVISGEAHQEGDVLENQLQVYRIENGGVVFLFKNFLKVRKRLNWHFGSNKP